MTKQGILYLHRSYLFILSAENKYKTFLKHIWQSDKDLLQSRSAHQKKLSFFFPSCSCSLELNSGRTCFNFISLFHVDLRIKDCFYPLPNNWEKLFVFNQSKYAVTSNVDLITWEKVLLSLPDERLLLICGMNKYKIWAGIETMAHSVTWMTRGDVFNKCTAIKCFQHPINQTEIMCPVSIPVQFSN